MKLPLIILAMIIVVVVLYLIIRGRAVPGGAAAPGTSSGRSRDVRSLVESFSRPAILVKTTGAGSTSYFGGLPPDSPGFVWPEREGRPLSFLACIDLGMVGGALDWLPRTGSLLFFYDTQEQPSGFDPKDRGGWAVTYVPDASIERGSATEPEGLREEGKIRRQSVGFEAASIPPAWDHEDLAELRLSDEEQEALIDLRSSLYGDSPSHQIGGYPDPIQSSEMALECQLASHGLFCGDSTGDRDPRAENLTAGASDWRLLFQMDSDDELDVMWGDAGMIYFWVRAQEAKAGDFSDAWLVLQCH